jgi:hypothetical protein
MHSLDFLPYHPIHRLSDRPFGDSRIIQPATPAPACYR